VLIANPRPVPSGLLVKNGSNRRAHLFWNADAAVLHLD
jgi:hypothetical protein